MMLPRFGAAALARLPRSEHAHQHQQQAAARDLRRRDGDERRADHHAHRIGRDDIAGIRHADLNPAATSGNSPMTANSPTPMAKPPQASARMMSVASIAEGEVSRGRAKAA